MEAVDIARTVSAADQMGSMNEELQKQLFNRIEAQKKIVDLRKIGAALDVNTKTVVRSAVVEQQRLQQEARKIALLAPPKPKDDSKLQAVPVLAHRVSDILSEAKLLVKQQSYIGEMDRPGSEQRSITARSSSGLEGTSAPSARRNSLVAPATKARVKPAEQASSKDDDLDDERYAGPARAVAAETKAALVALVHKKEHSRRSRLFDMNRKDEKLSELMIKKQQEVTPRKPSPAGHDRTSVGVEAPMHINAREEPRRQALVAKAEGKLRALANAEFMHRYADRLEFGADVCLCPENIMAAALNATSRAHGRDVHRHHIRPGAAGGYNPHTGHMEFSTVMGSSSDKGSREGGGDSTHDTGRSPPGTARQSQSNPAADPVRFPELRRYLHHIMAITAGRMVFNIPSKSFEVRYFTPLIEEMIILAFWHVQVRFIEERERQKANRKKAKARRLALKGASAAAAGETPVARRKAGLTPTNQAAQESRFSQQSSGGGTGQDNTPEAPDVSLTAQEEVEAELAAAMTPTYEGLTTMTCIGHYMALAYTTLMKNVIVERLAEDAEDEQPDTTDEMNAAATAEHTGIIAAGPEPAVQRKRKYLTVAEKRALAVARARMSRAFLDVLPWAIADTVWQAYWHLLAGSRGSYGAAFRLQIFVEIGRLLTGVELAPITVLSSLGRHFPTDPMALLHREFVEGAEAEAASLLMMGRRGQARVNSVDGSSSAASSELALKASNRGAHIYSARTPGQVSALLGGPLTGVPAGGSKSMKMALEEGEAENGPGNSVDDPYGLTKQEVDYVLTDQRVSHLARSLGFRTPFELFKSTRKADRLLLGLGEASRVEVLRKLHRTLALPVSAYLMSGAPVPPPLLQASATVGAMLNLPPASHPSMRKALDAGYQPLSPIAGTSGASMNTSLGKSLRHGITAVMNQEALQDAPTLANPALNSYLIHMERWAEEALADEVYRVNDEEAENRKRAILAAAAAVAAKQKARTVKVTKAPAATAAAVVAVVPVAAETKQDDSDEEVWVNPTPHSPARFSAASHVSSGRGFSSGYTLGGTKASLTHQLAGSIKRMAMENGMVSLSSAASSTPVEASELGRRQALLSVRSQTQMLRLTAELDAAGGHINKMARKIGKGLKKLVQEKLTHPSTADLDSTAHTAFSGLDESADFSAPNGLVPVLDAGHENSNRPERVVLPQLKKDNSNTLGFASMLAQESELAVPTLVTFRESEGVEGPGQAQGDARHVAGDMGAAQHGGGKTLVQFESSHARTQSRKARFPLLSPIDSGTPSRGSRMLQPELHSQGALAGTVTDRHGLASIVHTVPTGLGATDADLATKILTARSKKRPLQVPFVYTTASTLLTRALPDAKSQSKGHTAMKRLVPVSWAHVGGVDTAHAYYREAAKDHIDAIHNTNARIQAEAAAAAHATKVADYHARSSADTARVDLLKGSAQALAREAAKVRQERIKSSKERASKAQKQREEKRLYRTALGTGGKDILDLLGDGQDSPTARAASPVRGSRRKKDDGSSVINKSDPGFAGAVVMQGDPVLMNVKVPGVNKASLPPVSVNLMQLATLAGNTEGISGAHSFVLDMDRLYADTEAEKEERKQYVAIQAKSLAEQAKQDEEERRRKALAFR